ncbi:unnamed protein product [Dicrocoelium dendriticum]|nr:unnamed protein product [Dicrocoelium dendriticum]
MLHPRPTTSTNFAGQSPNTMKLKLQFLLILDRAAGVYLTLIQRLLHSIPDTCWPKSLLGAVTSYAAPTGMHKFARLGRTSGRFDLDLATFSALQHFGTTVSQGSLRCLDDKQEMDTLVTAPVAPRILSRGDRLPSQDALSSEASNPPPVSITSPTNHTTDVSQTGVFPSFPAPPTSVDRESAVNYLTQHCLVHLGDIARYRHQFNVAAGFYIWAWIVHPESGHPFNQLAILQSSKVPRKPVDTSMYYYIRAIACQCPFPAANTNLKNLLRTHPIQSHTSMSSVRPVRDACQLLTDLYVALSLEAESSVLVSLANEFVLSSSSPDPVWSAADDRRLLRLVTIHVYLLATHLENYSEEVIGLPLYLFVCIMTVICPFFVSGKILPKDGASKIATEA